MNIRIVRDHLDHKEGDTPTNLNDDQKKYLVAMGVAEYTQGKVDSPSLKQKQEQDEQALADKEKRAAGTEKVTKVTEPVKATPDKKAPKSAKPKK